MAPTFYLTGPSTRQNFITKFWCVTRPFGKSSASLSRRERCFALSVIFGLFGFGISLIKFSNILSFWLFQIFFWENYNQFKCVLYYIIKVNIPLVVLSHMWSYYVFNDKKYAIILLILSYKGVNKVMMFWFMLCGLM